MSKSLLTGTIVGISIASLCFGSSAQAAPAAESISDTEKIGKIQPEGKTPFDFDYYENLLQSLAKTDRIRICGLDKVCVNLWRKGKLQIFKEGRIFEGDFNSDGEADEAVILEEDDDDDSDLKTYCIHISTLGKDGSRRVILHEAIPTAQNIIDVFVDRTKNAIVIDTGGRLAKTTSIESLGGVGGYMYEVGRVIKVVAVVAWDKKSQKFDIFMPSYEKSKKKKQTRR
ncbi:MAG: hypothetical protein K2X27_18275 [Candidatus Obscuribacterales bacterium]|nr:hypothetical protein [Candidatus Obscuribacterales bacterium]